MKFQLFGRLRDDEDQGESQDESSGFPGMNQEPATRDMDTGSSLERMVDNMFDQGYSEEEITDELSGEYSRQDINDAINRAVANSATGGGNSGGPEPMSTYNGEGSAMSPMDEGFDNPQPENEGMGDYEDDMGGGGQPSEPEPQPVQQRQPSNGNVDPMTEELVETIVAENMDQILQEFEQTYGEIDDLTDKMEDLEERVHELEIRDDEDQKQFVSKVEEMENHVDDYQSRIGGLEKAFQQILPSLVDNVRDLTELVQEIKEERGIKTDKSVSKQDIKDIDVKDW